MIEFEEMVKVDGGCWLRFMKVPVQNPNTAGTKGAPPKGKPGVPTEEPKPIIGKAWVSLKDLQKPGSTNSSLRVALQTCPQAVKEADSDNFVDQEEAVEVFEREKTYIGLKLSLKKPIVSIESTKPEPQPADILPLK